MQLQHKIKSESCNVLFLIFFFMAMKYVYDKRLQFSNSEVEKLHRNMLYYHSQNLLDKSNVVSYGITVTDL